MCTILLSLSIFGQQKEEGFLNAWLEKVEKDAKTEVQVWAQNTSQNEWDLTYELVVERRDQKGNRSYNRQGGQAIIQPNEQKLISASAVNRNSADFFIARLKVYTNGRLLMADSIKLRNNLAQNQLPLENEKDEMVTEEELTGSILIMDNTRTRAGHDFYELFYTAWEPLPSTDNLVISVEEYPFRALTTIIKIKLDDIEVFSQNIHPQSRYLEAIAPMAAQIVRQRVEMLQALKRDLEEEDRKGSGIY